MSGIGELRPVHFPCGTVTTITQTERFPTVVAHIRSHVAGGASVECGTLQTDGDQFFCYREMMGFLGVDRLFFNGQQMTVRLCRAAVLSYCWSRVG